MDNAQESQTNKERELYSILGVICGFSFRDNILDYKGGNMATGNVTKEQLYEGIKSIEREARDWKAISTRNKRRVRELCFGK